MTRPSARWQRGVSLIEAVVAMAIMAVGMLGMLGVQATLRGNSDISKQRSEAVRIAQATMESRRAFSVLDTTAGATAYADIQTVTAAVAAQDNANTTFAREVVVTTFPVAADRDHIAPRKAVQVNVSWPDRNGETQWVRLRSIVVGNAPDIAAALAVPATGSPLQSVNGRSRAIPLSAVTLTGSDAGTSRFTPPGAATGISWIFSNTTGVITQICDLSVCTTVDARLVSGFVRFATTAAPPPPTAAHAAMPPDTSVPSGIDVRITLSNMASTVIECFESTPSGTSYILYYCAVPLATATEPWSGRSSLTGLTLASNASDATATRTRVCRYTTSRWNTATPVVANQDHPYNYSNVNTALTNQNFLVIKAGDGSVAYACPDDTSVLGRTFMHQPTS